MADSKSAFARASALAQELVDAGREDSIFAAMSTIWARHPELWRQHQSDREAARVAHTDAERTDRERRSAAFCSPSPNRAHVTSAPPARAQFALSVARGVSTPPAPGDLRAHRAVAAAAQPARKVKRMHLMQLGPAAGPKLAGQFILTDCDDIDHEEGPYQDGLAALNAARSMGVEVVSVARRYPPPDAA